MNITCQKLNEQDLDRLTALIRVYENVFEMHNFSMPHTDHLQTLLTNGKIIFYTALLNNVVVGGLTAHILSSTYYPSSEVYIYDLAVRTEYQRKGIGKQLIASLKEYCTGLGIKEIFVQADVVDQHALDFYKATGGVAENVIHFSYSLPKI
ncbi:MAG: GNAT family N-acetyltransferase [Bacteroidota bacterium]